jgi:hypothetical protein
MDFFGPNVRKITFGKFFFVTFAISSNLVKYAYGWWLFEQHHKAGKKITERKMEKNKMATIHKKI